MPTHLSSMPAVLVLLSIALISFTAFGPTAILSAPVAEAASEHAIQNPSGDEFDSSVAQAKAMVQSLREAGYTVINTVALQVAKHERSFEDEVVPFFIEFGSAIGGIVQKFIDVIDLPEPGLYQELFPNDWLACLDEVARGDHEQDDDNQDDELDACAPQAEHRYERLGDSHNRVLIGLDGNTYTFSEDADNGAYSVVVTNTRGIGSTNHYLVVRPHHVDSDGVPALITLDGAVTDGNLDVSLGGEVHLGPRVDELDGGPESITFVGWIRSDVPAISMKTDVTAQFASIDSHETFTLRSQVTASGEWKFPTFVINDSTDFEFTAYEFAVDNGDGEDESTLSDSLLNSLSWHASFSDRDDNPTRLETKLRVDLDLDALDFLSLLEGDTFPTGAFTISGSVQPPDDAWIDFEFSLTADGDKPLSGEILLDRRGVDTLQGTFIATVEPFAVQFTIQNQDGIQTRLNFPAQRGAVGTITKGDETLAEINVALGMVFIRYKDGTSETLF